MLAEARALATVDGLTNINFRERAIESFDEASVSCDLAKDIAGGGPTGMSPFRSVNGELMFRQNWGLVVAVKP
jgi:hypothetical protein